MKSDIVNRFLQTHIDTGDFPSAVYLIAEKGKIIFTGALGFAVVEPEKIKADIDTIYDLASLTKPLVTGLLCAKLFETGKLSLSDKITKYLRAFETSDKREITIKQLLTHSSGFRAWKPFYLTGDGEPKKKNALPKKENVLTSIAAEPLAKPIASAVLYSDLNFITLGFLLEEIYGANLDEIAKKEIFAPLDLKNTFYNPPTSLKKRIAASESGSFFEQNLSIENGFDHETNENQTNATENNLIWGAVHDGNARFLGGVSGHAGLFSNALETSKIARQFLAEETVLLKPETCALFRRNFTEGLNEARSLAFQLAETKDSTASGALSKDSFGHLGFTGTSAWIEPETRRIFILLTNRTHARALPFANINAVRRKFNELAVEISNARDKIFDRERKQNVRHLKD